MVIISDDAAGVQTNGTATGMLTYDGGLFSGKFQSNIPKAEEQTQIVFGGAVNLKHTTIEANFAVFHPRSSSRKK